MTGAPKATPATRYVGLSHQHSAPMPEEIAWNALGLPGHTVNVDTTPEPSPPPPACPLAPRLPLPAPPSAASVAGGAPAS